MLSVLAGDRPAGQPKSSLGANYTPHPRWETGGLFIAAKKSRPTVATRLGGAAIKMHLCLVRFRLPRLGEEDAIAALCLVYMGRVDSMCTLDVT